MSCFSDNCLKYKKDYSFAQYVCVWPERNPAMMFSASEEGRLELNVLKNYAEKQETKAPEQETSEVLPNASSPIHPGEHGQTSS